MTLDSMSESSLLQMERYLNSNPYREYAMRKPYFPKTSTTTLPTHTFRPHPSQFSSTLAYNELIDNRKPLLALDRFTYKLRMKSDLNVNNLRETRVRHHQTQSDNNNTNHATNDALSSIPLSLGSNTKHLIRQPTAITMTSTATKTLTSEEWNGIEGNAIRVGSLDDLIKQFRRAEFRLVRRPADYLGSATTNLSSNVSINERFTTKSHPHRKQHERPVKQQRALTEYRFNVPTFPSTPSRFYRDPLHQGLVYHYRMRERTGTLNSSDFPPLGPIRHVVTPEEEEQQQLNSLIVRQGRSTAISNHDKRIQGSREKSLMRTEKQLCVCNKLTIVDPFSTSAEQGDSNLPRFRSSRIRSAKYIFPPVRAFGYFTKKTTVDDNLPPVWSLPSAKKKKRRRPMKESIDKIGLDGTDEDELSQTFTDPIKSMIDVTDVDDELNNAPPNTTINIDFNVTETLVQSGDEQDEQCTHDNQNIKRN